MVRGLIPKASSISKDILLYFIIIWLTGADQQDESNPALRLAARAGTMEISCPLGITRCVPHKKTKKTKKKTCNWLPFHSL